VRIKIVYVQDLTSQPPKKAQGGDSRARSDAATDSVNLLEKSKSRESPRAEPGTCGRCADPSLQRNVKGGQTRGKCRYLVRKPDRRRRRCGCASRRPRSPWAPGAWPAVLRWRSSAADSSESTGRTRSGGMTRPFLMQKPPTCSDRMSSRSTWRPLLTGTCALCHTT
jgi:hypothetical protein